MNRRSLDRASSHRRDSHTARHTARGERNHRTLDRGLRTVLTLGLSLLLLIAACGGTSTSTTTTTGAPGSSTTGSPTSSTTGSPTSSTTGGVTTTPAPTTTAAPTTTTSEAPPETETIELSTGGDFGIHLVDADGMSLYMFLADSQDASTCYDACAVTWPPFVGEGAAGTGVDASLLGTSPRDDGSAQITYNGWPLYHYSEDSEPGDANGQGFGSAWFLLDVDGNPLGQAS